MKLTQNPYVALTVVTLCSIAFYVANTKLFFGKHVYAFFPCVQNPTDSFPCHSVYDIGVMVFAAGVGLLFLGIFAYTLYKRLKS